MIYSFSIFRSLANVSVLFGQTVRGVSAGARVFEYLIIKPKIPISGGKRFPHDDIRGHVIFKHVKFAYPTRKDQTVLSDFSLTIPAGKMVALCGPSGSGKVSPPQCSVWAQWIRYGVSCPMFCVGPVDQVWHFHFMCYPVFPNRAARVTAPHCSV